MKERKLLAVVTIVKKFNTKFSSASRVKITKLNQPNQVRIGIQIHFIGNIIKILVKVQLFRVALKLLNLTDTLKH